MNRIGVLFALAGFTIITLSAFTTIPIINSVEKGLVMGTTTLAQSANTQQQKDLFFQSPPTPTRAASAAHANPPTAGKSYCIDDEGSVPGNEPCDDASKFDIAKGIGGVTGSCGAVIEWAQKIMDVIEKGAGGSWSKMPTSFTSCGYTTTPTDQYVSTQAVIDAYNLAGLHELSAASHTAGQDMLNWWQSPTAASAGYTFLPATGDIQSILPQVKPGMAMFLGSHVGIVNSIEVDGNGNGWISLLHSNTSYWLGVVIVANWQVKNTPQNYPLTGFGGY